MHGNTPRQQSSKSLCARQSVCVRSNPVSFCLWTEPLKNSPAVQGWNLSASTFNPVIILPLVQPLWFPIPSSFGSPFSQLSKPNHPVSHWEFPKLRVSWAKNKKVVVYPISSPITKAVLNPSLRSYLGEGRLTRHKYHQVTFEMCIKQSCFLAQSC